MVLDIDGNGRMEALTDGILIVRNLFGLTGEPLIQGAVAADGDRTTAQEIQTYLDGVRNQFDIDGNGQVEALTDGILIVRNLFGLTGEPLIQGAVAADGSRITADDIEAYLESIENASVLPVDPETGAQYFPDELLVKLTTSDLNATKVEGLAQSLGAINIEPLLSPGLQSNSADGQWYVAQFDSDTDLLEVRNTLAEDPAVEDIELDYLLSTNFVPNDPRFNQLWGLNNTGQTGGTFDADIDAPEAWDIQRGSRDVVVAVIDSGVDYNHPDLAQNIWTNSGEIPNNGIDDDGNGFTDDFYGYDWVNRDGDPIDDDGHGTHVAGTIGAIGNNNRGVSGVSPNVSIMPLKFLGANGSGSTINAVRAVSYAVEMGADVINASFGGGPFSFAMVDALESANDAGVLFVAAAGNNGSNNDFFPHYPSNYNVPNVLSVAATDSSDRIAFFSNYGQTTVDLGAPGVGILSTLPSNDYEFFNGTSMAAPHVAGAAALLLAEDPSLTPTQLKNILMTTADPIASLQGRTVSGGRLNLNEAILAVADSSSPPSNQPPVAENDAVTITLGTTANIPVLINDSDEDGDSIFISNAATTSAAGGTVTRSSNSLIYTPAFGFIGNDSFNYTISDGNGGTDSAIVSVTVEGAIAGPDNDNFANAQQISGSSITEIGLNVDATKELSEPDHAGDDGGSSVWWSWTAPNSGSVTITTAGSNFDTLLGVYTGNSLLSLTEVASNDDVSSFFDRTSSVTFNAVAGTNYKIAVDGWNNDSGNITLNLETGSGSPNNFPPIAVSDFAITDENTAVSIDVLANDFDFDGNSISIIDFDRTSTNGGVIARDNNGSPFNQDDDSLLYTPAANFSGSDSFTYAISDGQGGTDTANVRITVISESGFSPFQDTLTGTSASDSLVGSFSSRSQLEEFEVFESNNEGDLFIEEASNFPTISGSKSLTTLGNAENTIDGILPDFNNSSTEPFSMVVEDNLNQGGIII